MTALALVICAIGGLALGVGLVTVYALVLFRFDDSEPDSEYRRIEGRLLWVELEQWRAAPRRPGA